MYVFLLVLGAVTALAGMSLVASGVSSHQGDVDTALIISGTIAFVGGLILIGLGLTVNVLLRIERALGRGRCRVRLVPMRRLRLRLWPRARPARPANPVSRHASHSRRNRRTSRACSLVAAAPAPPGRKRIVRADSREKFPTLAGSKIARWSRGPTYRCCRARRCRPTKCLASCPTVTPMAKPTAARRHAPRSRPDAKPRPARAPERRKPTMFESLWPKGARWPRRSSARRAEPSPSPPSPEPEQRAEPAARTVSPSPRQPPRADAGLDPQVRRCRRHGLHALFGRFDRGAAAAGHSAVRLDHRTAQSHRARRVGL